MALGARGGDASTPTGAGAATVVAVGARKALAGCATGLTVTTSTTPTPELAAGSLGVPIAARPPSRGQGRPLAPRAAARMSTSRSVITEIPTERSVSRPIDATLESVSESGKLAATAEKSRHLTWPRRLLREAAGRNIPASHHVRCGRGHRREGVGARKEPHSTQTPASTTELTSPCGHPSTARRKGAGHVLTTPCCPSRAHTNVVAPEGENGKADENSTRNAGAGILAPSSRRAPDILAKNDLSRAAFVADAARRCRGVCDDNDR